MNPVYEKLMKCYESVVSKIDFKPQVALILGSGLGNYADKIKVEAVLPYSEIEGFPVSTAPSHKGQFVFGYVGDVKVVCMQGRVHYYEGYPITDVVLPVRLMKLLGAEILFITNASGGLNPDFKVGDFMILNDHISIFAPNPLIGSNIDELGVRFPDMTTVYDKDLIDTIKEAAKELDIDIKEGIYTQLTGPSYEAPAEIKLLAKLGTDAVGMSTVVEAIAANHMGMRICCISCICNMAAGISKNPLTQEEVEETGRMVATKFEELVSKSIIKFKK